MPEVRTKKEPAVIGQFVGKCCDANVVNNNDMHLSRELFETLFASDDYKRGMEHRHYMGFLGHPENVDCQEYEHACIVMTDCQIDDNGDVVGTFDVLNTPVGKVVKTLVDAGVELGISIRGAGDVDGSGEVDPDTFVFRGFDLVTFPAYNDCIPEFQEIAASKDVEKQVKFKKICSSINKELSNINSASAIDVIKEQFKPGTEEYKKLEARKAEILSSDEVDVDLLNQKIKGVTKLYVDQVKANSELSAKLVSAQMDAYHAKQHEKRVISAAKRIYTEQMDDMSYQLNELENKVKSQNVRMQESVTASSRMKETVADLKAQIRELQADNLKYKQKIESSTKLIQQKDDKISELSELLDKTVTSNQELQRVTSNRDAEIHRQKSTISASEKLIIEYQQAYANMYANALGVNLRDIPITSATTVEDLQKIIANSSTSASYISDYYGGDIPDDVMFESNDDNDIVTM